MVKGTSRRVIVVDSPDKHLFEQAIFIVRNDAAHSGVSAQQLVEEAYRVAKNYTRTHRSPQEVSRHKATLFWTVLSVAAIGGIALLFLL